MSEKRTVEEKHKRLPTIEKTYGEKVHNLIFNKLINFWTTLAISGLFVYWFKHSTSTLPKTVFGGVKPSEFHQGFRETFQKMGFVKTLGRTEQGAQEIGNVMADALSINLPGTLTILPSAYFGAKYKTQIVEALDRKHYGVNAEDDPAIAERHAAIRAEKKPTVLGAITARIGTMGASVGASFLIGADKNMIKRMGGNFNGVDTFAGEMGLGINRALTKTIPGVEHVANGFGRAIRTDWTRGPQNTSGFTSAFEGIMKYTALDVMYTIITSSTITPFVRLVKNLPFMSYTEKAKAPAKSARPAVKEETVAKIEPTTIEETHDRPRAHVSHVAHNETITPQQATELQH